MLKPIPLEKDFPKNPAMPMKMISVLNKLETFEVLDHHCFMVFGLHTSPFKKKRYSTRYIVCLYMHHAKGNSLTIGFPLYPKNPGMS